MPLAGVEGLHAESQLYYVVGDDPVLLGIEPAYFSTLLPGRFTRRFVLADARRQVSVEVERNCGRLRYDLEFAYKRMDEVQADKGYAGPVLACGVVLRPIAGYRADSLLVKYVAGRRDMELWFAPIAGTALMASSGYLISRAALRPDILSLTIVIVGVRFFALARAALRYLERLVSHDTAFRFLAQARVTFFERLEPLVPGAMHGTRPGELLSGFVADVDALQHLLVRVVGPPAAALTVGAAAALTAALLVPEAGPAPAPPLVLGAGVVALPPARIAPAAGRRRPHERAELAGGTGGVLAGLPALGPERAPGLA